MDAGRTRLHGSCVAVDGQGLLVLGASGSGKSNLALRLMAYGAALVADDQVILTARDGRIVAASPPVLRGRIEARGLGLLRATPAPPVPLAAVADLDRAETERLPPLRHITLLGLDLPLFHRVDGIDFAAALMQVLRGGRSDPDD